MKNTNVGVTSEWTAEQPEQIEMMANNGPFCKGIEND